MVWYVIITQTNLRNKPSRHELHWHFDFPDFTATLDTLQVTGTSTNLWSNDDIAGSRTKGTKNKNAKALTMHTVPSPEKRREINYKYIYASLKLGFLHLALNFCHFSRYYAKWGYFTTSVPLLPLPKWVLGPDHVQVYCSWQWIGKIFYKKNYSSLYL